MDSHLAAEIANFLSCHDSGDVDATVRVAIHSLARILADREHLRRQVTELQAHNTALEERARAAEKSAKDAGGAAPSTSFAVIADLGQQRDEARKALRLEREQHSRVIEQWEAAKSALAAATTETQRALHALDGARRERDEARAALVHEREYRARAEQDLFHVEGALGVGTGAALAGVRSLIAFVKSAHDVPPELARLWKAAQGARAKWGAPTQRFKTAVAHRRPLQRRARVGGAARRAHGLALARRTRADGGQCGAAGKEAGAVKRVYTGAAADAWTPIVVIFLLTMAFLASIAVYVTNRNTECAAMKCSAGRPTMMRGECICVERAKP